MRTVPAAALAAALALLYAGPARAQANATPAAAPADSRAELLAKIREQKAQALEPYKPTGVEKALLYMEDNRILERLSVADGWYPRFGGLATGSGFAGGVGFRNHMLHDTMFFNVGGSISTKAYKALDAELDYPRLFDDRLIVSSSVRWRDFPQEDFFGIGSDSTLTTRTNYRYKGTDLSTRIEVNVPAWLRFGGDIGLLWPKISPGTDTRMPSIEQIFTDAEAPGLLEQPSFLYKSVFVQVDYRDQPGNARSGGLWRATYGMWNDRQFNRYDVGRFDAEIAHFFPIFDKKRVIALHLGAAFVNNDPGERVPFYFLPYIGGSDTVRGFREFRFRDENAAYVNAEYRWEAFSGLDMALFVDAGKVARNWEDINLSDLETSYGVGFRFNTYKSVFLRLDVGTGGGEGTRIFFKFGPAF
jgi:outer membrane protein assembly factor BamA